jgi:hypothetical protein
MTMRRIPGQRRPAQASGRIAACLAIVAVAIVTTPGSLAQASLAPVAPAPRPVARAARVTPPVAPDVCIAGRSDVRRLSAAFDHRGPGWAGADLTASVPLGDDRVLWLFGDTFVGRVATSGVRAPGTLMVNNSAMVQTGNCFRPLLGGTPAAPAAWIAPARRDGSWYWPADAVVDGGRLHVLLMHVVDTGGKIGHVDGIHRATLRLPDLTLERIVAIPHTSQRHYGIGTSYDDAFVYLWGSAQRWRGSWDRAMFVARVPRGRLDSGQLEYWTGGRWSPDARAAKPVVAEGLGHKVSVHQHRGGWLAVSKRAEFMSDDLAAWWAPTPEGPWKSLGRLLAVPRHPTAGTFTYMGSAHPALRQPDGRLIVAWNVNTFDLKALIADAYLYGPRFALVTVPPVR